MENLEKVEERWERSVPDEDSGEQEVYRITVFSDGSEISEFVGYQRSVVVS